jgi:hypothetical protein
MGKVSQLSNTLPCFALAIWWSYSKPQDIRTVKTWFKTQTSSDVTAAVNGLLLAIANHVRISNAYL